MDPVTVIVIGHGSRDPAANVEFEDLVARYREARSQFVVRYAYVELANPSIDAALQEAAASAKHVVVMPLFLFAAGHVKNDIPLALQKARGQNPEVRFTAARSLGVHPALASLAFERAASVEPIDAESAKSTAVIVVGRGASDPDANADFCKQVRMISEGRKFAWVLPSFIGIARPSFEEAAELIARARPQRLLVMPYFLFGGRLIAKLQDQVATFTQRFPWIKTVQTPHLGVHETLFSLLDERILEALNGAAPLPCDNCQFRTPLPGLAENVGGLKALLWSLRHSYTHAQAVPHIHAHKPIKKHVLVCGNIDCAERGSISLIESLRRKLHDAGQEQSIKITRTSCMGRCGEGPTVAVYPDGVWYRGVRDTDAEELVSEHLLKDRIVGRLVDNIMH